MNQRVLNLQKWISSEGIILVAILFSSSRSCVLEVKNAKNSQVEVLKVRYSNDIRLSHEFRILETLDHPNIVKAKGFLNNENFSVLRMEKVEGECLIDEVCQQQQQTPLLERTVKCIANQLICCLLSLKKLGLVYFDLKPDNLIFNKANQKLKLIDFENVFPFSELKQWEIGLSTPQYVSPEVLSGCQYGWEAQIWSLGVTLFVLLTGELPSFQPFLEERSSIDTLRTTFQVLVRSVRKTIATTTKVLSSSSSSSSCVILQFPQECKISLEGQAVLRSCLEIDPKKRPCLETLSKHSWVLEG